MKLGINTLFLIPGEVGGTETYLRQTMLAMAKTRPDVALHLFTQEENDSVLRKELGSFPHVTFEKLSFHASFRPMRILREQTELPWRVARAGIDVLWSPGYTCPLHCSVPQMVTIHDMQYKHHSDDFSLLALWATDVLVQAAARIANRILTVSNFSKSEIVRYTGIAESKIVVSPNAVDPAFGTPMDPKQRTELLEHLQIGRGPYLLAVSNSYPHKNMAAVVYALAAVESEIPHRLVMVGQPRRGEPEILSAKRCLKDPDRLLRLHRVSREDLIVLYQGADVFVFPSLYEGFGLPVLEAMMAGVPVVTTRKGSIPEVGGGNVLYSDDQKESSIGPKVIEIVRWSMEYRKQFVEQARKRAESFVWDQTAKISLDVALEIVGIR